MIKNDLLANNPFWIVDIGASGGIDPRWINFKSSYKLFCLSQIGGRTIILNQLNKII